MARPKVGIAVPAYNAKRYLERCLATLNAQTYPVSIYIEDDYSDDGTYGFLADRPTWYTQLATNTKREGWPTSLNRAVQMAIDDGCEAVFLMNADDFLRLDCIEKCVEAIKGEDWVIPYGQQIGAENVVQTPLEDPLTYESFQRVYCPIGASGLIRKEVWETVGGFSTDISLPDSYGYNEDWDFWLKAWEARFIKYAIVREPVYYYIMHEGQLHRDGLARHEEARELIFKKHNLRR